VKPDGNGASGKAVGGAEPALDELVAALYGELHRIAACHLRSERPAHTLQITALVNEAYLKLAREGPRGFTDRAHFLALASRVMRQVLVDYARARGRRKRSPAGGAGEAPVEWTESLAVEAGSSLDRIDLLDLDAAIDALAAEDPSLAQDIEMHYFGGMTAEEIAAVRVQSVHIVRHDLRLAQAWLRRKLSR